MTSTQLPVYCNCTPVIDAQYERDGDRSLAEVLVEALADAEGVAATELPPLYDTIDPDALARMFERHDGVVDADALLRFKFGDWDVFVRADGRIRVCDTDRSTDPTPVFEDSTEKAH